MRLAITMNEELLDALKEAEKVLSALGRLKDLGPFTNQRRIQEHALQARIAIAKAELWGVANKRRSKIKWSSLGPSKG